MGHFYQVLNVLVGPDGFRVDTVEAVRRVAGSLGLITAGEDETADRTLLVATPAGTPWAAVYDDAFEVDERAAPELALAIQRAAGRPVVGVTVDDNALTELFLCDDGRVVDAFSAVPGGTRAEERRVPELWSAALVGSGADVGAIRRAWLAGGPAEARLAEVARVLGLSPEAWVALIDTAEPSEAGLSTVELRFRAGDAAAKPGATTTSSAASSALMIPALLCAPEREVKRKWRQVAKRYLATSSWDDAWAGLAMMPIDDAPGDIMLSKGPMGADRGNVLLYPVVDDLFEAAYRDADRAGTWHVMRDALVSGVRTPWFALAVLGSNNSPLLPYNVPGVPLAQAARSVLEGLVHWWDAFVRVERRFSLGGVLPGAWPNWSRVPIQLAAELGVTEKEWIKLDCVDARTAGERFRAWLGNS
jgi:hypothetical protein